MSSIVTQSSGNNNKMSQRLPYNLEMVSHKSLKLENLKDLVPNINALFILVFPHSKHLIFQSLISSNV